jgi:riboflavin kinase/FMN adenylyltransferase
MEIIRGLHNLRPAHRGCVATIGNFDGMHRGHQALLHQLRDTAAGHRLPSTAIIFEPQPLEYFAGTEAPPRLTRLREKVELLREGGIARVLCLRFDAQLAAMDGNAFIERVLVQGLGVKAVIIGEDFRFGRKRSGDVALLVERGTTHGYQVERADTFCLGGERVSSSRVRTALAAGDMEEARHLLGRYYNMSGRVGHGEKRGREIGFPTLNIHLHRLCAPVDGIFAARVHGLDVEAVDGMAYIGDRPVVSGQTKGLEVHLFDYSADCYGRHVHVELIRKLREDQRFDSLEALRKQMHIDADRARVALAEA